MTLVDLFTSLADKIRSKLGTTDKYSPISAIEAIDDVYDKGVVDGTTPTQTKTITAGTSAVTVNPDSGYALSSVTVNPTPSQTKSATPSTSAQTISPDSGKLLSSVSISAIATETKTQAAGTSNVDVTPTSGKYLTKVTVTPTPTQEKTITASRSAQTVTPDSGKHLSKVTVNKYPDATGTYTPTSNSSALDMGVSNNYRYINTNTVYNLPLISQSGAYTGMYDTMDTLPNVTLTFNKNSSGTYKVPVNTKAIIIAPYSDETYVNSIQLGAQTLHITISLSGYTFTTVYLGCISVTNKTYMTRDVSAGAVLFIPNKVIPANTNVTIKQTGASFKASLHIVCLRTS